MSEEQNKAFAEKAFWNSWVTLLSNGSKNVSQNEKKFNMAHSPRSNAADYADRVAQQQAEERRKENFKLITMIVIGFLAICLLVYLLGLIHVKSELSSTASDGKSRQSAAQTKEDPAEIEASIQEEMKKGGYTSRDDYFSAELAKQSLDVGDDLVEFSKRIKSATSKMNITGLVIAKKIDQIQRFKTINGFGVELVRMGDESDDVKLISHLKGMTSSVEFFAENGRVVAHFKDYPSSYCAGTKGAAVCGS